MTAKGEFLNRLGQAAVCRELTVTISYAIITFLFWGAFVKDRGLHAETGMIVLSDQHPGIDGFVYPYDASRKYMSASFHLAYLFSNGSYLSLHIVMGIWVFLSGYLGYRILQFLLPGQWIWAYLAGALTITFGADGGLIWPGYMVQRQTVGLAMLAALFLLMAWTSASRLPKKVFETTKKVPGPPKKGSSRTKNPELAVAKRPKMFFLHSARPWILLAAVPVCQYFSLWTYEACLPMLLVFPLLLLRRGLNKRRFAAYTLVWSLVPVAKLATLVWANLIRHQQSYEANVLAKSSSLSTILSKFWFFLSNGLAFWHWPSLPFNEAAGCLREAASKVFPPTILAVMILLFGLLIVGRIQGGVSFKIPALRVAGIALVFLLLSYVPFVMLEVPSLLRTELIAGLPGAVLLLALASLVIGRTPKPAAALAAFAAIVLGYGVISGDLQQLGLAHDWAGYRNVVKPILEAAPCVKDDTMFVLVDVPTRWSSSVCARDAAADPFRDVLWFNVGLQVLYPKTRLVGIYYRTDGSGSDSIRFKFGPQGAVLDHAGVGVADDRFDYAHMIAFRFLNDGSAALLDRFPEAAVPGATNTDAYRPRDLVTCGLPSEFVKNRLNW